MTEKIRKKAHRALLRAWTYGNRHFPHVWVCGDHIYFSENAANLQKLEYKRLHDMDVPVEIVTYEEACKHDVEPHPHWKKEVDEFIYMKKAYTDNNGCKKVVLNQYNKTK